MVAYDNTPLQIKLLGKKLHTPLMIPSGTGGFGEEYLALEGFSFTDVGALMLKSLTMEPRKGNPVPRIAETPCGMLNSIGLQNPGVAAFKSTILPKITGFDTEFIANVAGWTVEDYASVAASLESCPRIWALEANISCPNVKKGGVQFGTDPDAAYKVVRAVCDHTTKPVIAKLTPNVTNIAEIARACVEAGATCLSLINTLKGMAIDIERRRPVLANNIGGLSGPAIKPVALAKVVEVYKEVKADNIPIIGMGGVASAQDVIEFVLAGANAVAIGTAAFYSPGIYREICQDLLRILPQLGVKNIGELVGKLELN